MATIRVFLLTFRRARLLPRAVDSLLAQTFTDWICELHNGDPADPFPGELVARIGDPRLRLVLPPRRTGPVEAFNAAHQRALEPYQSLLEDDNWWEPTFLEHMLRALEAHPETDLAWANMRIAHEESDGTWTDTGQTVWNLPPHAAPRLFHWPQLLHFADFLYSNGAMLLRSSAAERLIMPADSHPDMIEHVRERQMRFPILLVPEPLANFGVTRGTFRSRNFLGWGESQALLGAAFLRAVPMTHHAQRSLWAHRRKEIPRSTNGLFFAALVSNRPGFLRWASPGDWWVFLRGCIRRPAVAWRVLRSRQRLPLLWHHILEITQARTAEARAEGFGELDSGTLLDKRHPDATR